MAKEDGEMGGDRGPHKHRGIHELGRVEHQDARNGTDRKVLGDGERSAPPPIETGSDRLAATAHSDHGPHNIGSKSKPLPK